MSRILTLSRDNRNISGRRHKTVRREIIIGPNAIKFIAVAICAILAMVYLSQSTAGANRSLKIGDLQSREAELQLEKESLEVEQTRLKSLKTIDSNIDPNVLQAPVAQVTRPNSVPIVPSN